MIFSLYRRTKKKTESVTEISSAMGKHSHTRLMFPVRDRKYATGSRTQTWRARETSIEYTALPIAWNTEPSEIATAAPKKLGAIIRSAGTPILSICSDALNRPSSGRGNSSNKSTPNVIIEAASTIAFRIVFVIRFRFRAP